MIVSTPKPVKVKNKIKRFYCKNNRKPNDVLQGIIFQNGRCAVGLDVWRMLDKADCPSYEYDIYNNLEEALLSVQIIKVNHSKAYYLPFS